MISGDPIADFAKEFKFPSGTSQTKPNTLFKQPLVNQSKEIDFSKPSSPNKGWPNTIKKN